MARLKIGSTVQTVDGDTIKIKEELGLQQSKNGIDQIPVSKKNNEK